MVQLAASSSATYDWWTVVRAMEVFIARCLSVLTRWAHTHTTASTGDLTLRHEPQHGDSRKTNRPWRHWVRGIVAAVCVCVCVCVWWKTLDRVSTTLLARTTGRLVIGLFDFHAIPLPWIYMQNPRTRQSQMETQGCKLLVWPRPTRCLPVTDS